MDTDIKKWAEEKLKKAAVKLIQRKQGLTYCRSSMKGTHLSRTSKRYCSKCGFRVRGDNHYEGRHHKIGKDGKL